MLGNDNHEQAINSNSIKDKQGLDAVPRQNESHSVQMPRSSLEFGESRLSTTSTILVRLQCIEVWLNQWADFEQRGVQRIFEDEKRAPRKVNMMLIWFSAILNPEYLSVGTLGPILGLSVWDSLIILFASTIVGSLFPAFTGTLCPPTGLRQIAMSRFAFGFWGAKLCSALNIISNLGWGVIACILAGDMLAAISAGSLDVAVGIAIIVTAAFVLTFLGLRIIQHWQSVAWILIAIIMSIQFAQSAKYFPADLAHGQLNGLDYTGSGLTFFAILLGTSVPWCTLVGDYLVEYPANTNKPLIAVLTWIGIALPTLFVNTLGIFIGAMIQSDSDLANQHNIGGVGAVMLATMRPSGWGIFAGVVYTLSLLSNLSINIYSSSLCMQLLSKRFQSVPRFVWIVFVTLICLAVSMGGRNHLQQFLTNFLSILAYWAIIFGLIMAMEHFIFRPKLGGYDVDGWEDAQRLPLGIAGTVTLLTNFALSFLGMNQTWYMGPISKKIGIYGGDVGDYIIIVGTLIMYPPLRAYEISYGRRA